MLGSAQLRVGCTCEARAAPVVGPLASCSTDARREGRLEALGLLHGLQDGAAATDLGPNGSAGWGRGGTQEGEAADRDGRSGAEVGRSGSEWVPGGNVNYVFGCNVNAPEAANLLGRNVPTGFVAAHFCAGYASTHFSTVRPTTAPRLVGVEAGQQGGWATGRMLEGGRDKTVCCMYCNHDF